MPSCDSYQSVNIWALQLKSIGLFSDFAFLELRVWEAFQSRVVGRAETVSELGFILRSLWWDRLVFREILFVGLSSMSKLMSSCCSSPAAAAPWTCRAWVRSGCRRPAELGCRCWPAWWLYWTGSCCRSLWRAVKADACRKVTVVLLSLHGGVERTRAKWNVTCLLSFSGTWLKNSHACQKRIFSSLNSFFRNSCRKIIYCQNQQRQRNRHTLLQ